jgi:hypothetical protein
MNLKETLQHEYTDWCWNLPPFLSDWRSRIPHVAKLTVMHIVISSMARHDCSLMKPYAKHRCIPSVDNRTSCTLYLRPHDGTSTIVLSQSHTRYTKAISSAINDRTPCILCLCHPIPIESIWSFLLLERLER